MVEKPARTTNAYKIERVWKSAPPSNESDLNDYPKKFGGQIVGAVAQVSQSVDSTFLEVVF